MTKTSTTKPTATKTETAQAVEQQYEDLDIRAMAASLGITIPTGREMLVGLGVSFLVGFVGSYVAAKFAIAVFVGAVLLTGSTFMAYIMALLVYIIGAVAAVYAGSKASVYVTSGKAAEHIEKSVGFIKGFFTRKSSAINSVAA